MFVPGWFHWFLRKTPCPLTSLVHFLFLPYSLPTTSPLYPTSLFYQSFEHSLTYSLPPTLPLNPNSLFCLSLAHSFSLYIPIPFSVCLSLTPSLSTTQFLFLSISPSLLLPLHPNSFFCLYHAHSLTPTLFSLCFSDFLPLSLFSISLQTKVEISTTRFKLFLLDLFNSHTLFLLKGHTTKHPCLRRLFKKNVRYFLYYSWKELFLGVNIFRECIYGSYCKYYRVIKYKKTRRSCSSIKKVKGGTVVWLASMVFFPKCIKYRILTPKCLCRRLGSRLNPAMKKSSWN